VDFILLYHALREKAMSGFGESGGARHARRRMRSVLRQQRGEAALFLRSAQPNARRVPRPLGSFRRPAPKAGNTHYPNVCGVSPTLGKNRTALKPQRKPC